MVMIQLMPKFKRDVISWHLITARRTELTQRLGGAHTALPDMQLLQALTGPTMIRPRFQGAGSLLRRLQARPRVLFAAARQVRYGHAEHRVSLQLRPDAQRLFYPPLQWHRISSWRWGPFLNALWFRSNHAPISPTQADCMA